MSDKNNNTIHPDYGVYDRMLFNNAGEITRKSYEVDDRGVMIKLGNRVLDLDHMHSRNDIMGNKDPTDKVEFPTFRIFGGEADCFGYNVIVGEQANIETKPAKFVLLSRLYKGDMIYNGGLSCYALDQNDNWKGIQMPTVHAWVRWVEQITDYDKDAFKGLGHWLNKCKTSTTMRLSQTVSSVLSEARRNSFVLVNNTPASEVKVEPKKEEPKQETKSVVVVTPPVPVPLSGKLSEIEKITGELVAIG